jgi:hypothetical protein
VPAPPDPGREVVNGAGEPWEVLPDGLVPIPAEAEATGGSTPDSLPLEDRLQECRRRIATDLLKMGRSFAAGIRARIDLGDCLIEAKSLCRHGQWLPFLESCEIKDRTAQEYMSFAENRATIEALIEEFTHRGADLTVRALRKVLSPTRKAIGQGPKTGSTGGPVTGCEGGDDPTVEDRDDTTGEPAGRWDTTKGAEARGAESSDSDPATEAPDEPAATAATNEPANASGCDDAGADGDDPADGSSQSAATDDETSDPETACRGDVAGSYGEDDQEPVATTAASPQVTIHRHMASKPCREPATGSPTSSSGRAGDNAGDGGRQPARAATGGPEPAGTALSPPAEELSLEDIPLRDELADPTIFDALARLAHRARPHFADLEKLLEDDATIQWHLKNAEFRALSIAVLIQRLVRVPSCKSWILCWQCHGKGKASGGNACMTCGGAGCTFG